MINSSDKWMKAAVAGGLWAGFEIGPGSMLYSLHLPFSGTIMASFSVIMMIAFMQIWKTKGIIWRAGLICGLMKSLSPGAVIIGPITLIMTEALLMELSIIIMGRNLPGYLFAGAGALLGVLVFKIVKLFLLFGTGIVQLFTRLIFFLKEQLGMDQPGVETLVFFILAMYILMGLAAALTGFYLGRYAGNISGDKELKSARIEALKNDWYSTGPNQPFSIPLFFMHLALIPGSLILLNRFGLSLPSLIPCGAYTLFLLIYYKRTSRRLLKPKSWIQFLIIIPFAGLFWNPQPEGVTMHGAGLLMGLEMCVRAIVIISAFSALSTEIRNPKISDRLFGLGLGNVRAALSFAFNSLPLMLERAGNLKSFLKNPALALTRIISDADMWLKRQS